MHLIDGLAQDPGPLHPPQDVAAPVAARQPGCRPTEMTTGRPARRSSSAIWTPDTEAPTTSTRRRHLVGSPVAAGVGWSISGLISLAADGT